MLRCPRHVIAFGLAALGLLVGSPALAGTLAYTVDSSASELTLSGSWNGKNLWPQRAESLVTSYAGSIDVDLTPESLQIVDANLDAIDIGRYMPSKDGKLGAALADYAGWFRTSIQNKRGNLNLALRDLGLDLASQPIALTDHTFDAGLLTAALDGNLDYAGVGKLRGLVGRGRASFSAGDLANSPTSTGSLTAENLLETLTIPIHTTFQVRMDTPLPDAYETLTFTLTGNIVARRTGSSEDFPEPATLALAALGMAGVLVRRSHRVQ